MSVVFSGLWRIKSVFRSIETCIQLFVVHELWFFFVSQITLLQQCADTLRTDINGGLTTAEVHRRQLYNGFNEFDIKDHEPLWRKYIDQVKHLIQHFQYLSALIFFKLALIIVFCLSAATCVKVYWQTCIGESCCNRNSFEISKQYSKLLKKHFNGVQYFIITFSSKILWLYYCWQALQFHCSWGKLKTQSVLLWPLLLWWLLALYKSIAPRKRSNIWISLCHLLAMRSLSVYSELFGDYILFINVIFIFCLIFSSQAYKKQV